MRYREKNDTTLNDIHQKGKFLTNIKKKNYEKKDPKKQQ